MVQLSECSTISYNYDGYIEFHWSGALTSNSLIIKAFPLLDNINDQGLSGSLMLYQKDSNNKVTNVKDMPLTIEDDDHPVIEIDISSLAAKTLYYYGFIFYKDVTNVAQTFTDDYKDSNYTEFSFTTLGMALTKYNFSFIASSQTLTGSDNVVFQSIVKEEASFFVHMGNLFENTADPTTTDLYFNYHKVFNSPGQRGVYHLFPIFYNWHRKDYGFGYANTDSFSKGPSTRIFKSYVPYTPLKNYLPQDDSKAFPGAAPTSDTTSGSYKSAYTVDPTYGIYRSYIVGRCLFIQLDLISFADLVEGDTIGDEQMTWLENQLIFAATNANIAYVFLISSMGWIHGDSRTGWANYPDNQQKIGNLITKYIYGKGKELMVLAGGIPIAAIDDGTNNDYGEFPVVQAAPLDEVGSCVGGPYSHGLGYDVGQYAVIHVTDDSAGVCVSVDLKRRERKFLTYKTCGENIIMMDVLHHCPVRQVRYKYIKYIIIFGCVFCGLFIIGNIIWCQYRYKKRNPERKIKVDEFKDIGFSMDQSPEKTQY